MMKVSDPSCSVTPSASSRGRLRKHAATFTGLGVNPNNGLGDLYAKLRRCRGEEDRNRGRHQGRLRRRPALAMVDSDRGITNLHVPSDIIVDASMPVVIREAGKMWGPDGKLHETKALIPIAATRRRTARSSRTASSTAPSTGNDGSVPNVG